MSLIINCAALLPNNILNSESALIFRCNCATCFGVIVPQKKE